MSESLVFITIYLITIFGSLLMFYLIYTLIEYYTTRTNNRISFDNLRKFYEINPKKWTLYRTYVSYNKGIWGDTNFSFSFMDYLRYTKWKYKQKKYEKEILNIKQYQDVIDDIKDDIRKFEQANNHKIQQEVSKYKEYATVLTQRERK